jgi:hypothetical protein
VSRSVASAIALLLLSVEARAQSPETWLFVARFQDDYASNLAEQIPNGVGDDYATLLLRLAWSQKTPRLKSRIIGWGSGVAFRELSNLDGFQGGLDGSVSYAASPRINLSLSQSLQRGFDPEALQLGVVGYPTVNLESAATHAASSFIVSPETSVRADFSFEWVHYGASSLFSGSQVVVTNPSQNTLLFPLATTGTTPTSPAAEIGSSVDLLNLLGLEGIQANNLDVLTSRVGLSVTHSFSTSTSALADFGYRWSSFSPAVNFASGGDEIDGDASLRHRLNDRLGVSLNYSLRSSAAQNPNVNTQTVTGGAQLSVSPHLSIAGSLGATYFSEAQGGASNVTPSGGVGLIGTYPRTGFQLRYDRLAYQALGFGTNQLFDVFAATLSHRVSRHVTVGANASYRRAEDLSNNNFLYDSQYYSANVSWRASSGVVLGGRGGYARLDSPLNVAISSVIWGIYAQYGHVWK